MRAHMSRSSAALVSLIGIVGVGYLDYHTGHDLGWFAFYFPPIALASWYLGAVCGGIAVVLCTASWFLADYWLGHVYPSVGFAVWNTGVRTVSFVVVAAACVALKGAFDRERKASDDLKFAMTELKVLRGLLPICSSCKKIRDDQGAWQPIESYISKHSEAQFSHGYCEQCYRASLAAAGLSDDDDEGPTSSA